MILVDATVWIDYLNGVATPQTGWLDENLPNQRLGLTDITLCEVLQGVKDRNQAVRVRQDLMAFEILTTGGTDLALAAADNYRALRELGITVRKTIDCWIASFCIREGHSLLHNDRDFNGFERHLGLKVVHATLNA
jgi:predicted nucleic acid-binding protein